MSRDIPWGAIILIALLILVLLDGFFFGGQGNPDCPGMPMQSGC